MSRKETPGHFCLFYTAHSRHAANEIPHLRAGIYTAGAVDYLTLAFGGQFGKVFESRGILGKRVAKSDRYLRLFLVLHDISFLSELLC